MPQLSLYHNAGSDAFLFFSNPQFLQLLTSNSHFIAFQYTFVFFPYWQRLWCTVSLFRASNNLSSFAHFIYNAFIYVSIACEFVLVVSTKLDNMLVASIRCGNLVKIRACTSQAHLRKSIYEFSINRELRSIYVKIWKPCVHIFQIASSFLQTAIETLTWR